MGFMDFISGNTVWVYIFIFFGKIIEVTVSTLRLVLINRGERLIGSLIALIEFTIWIFVTGTVLVNFQKDLLKVVILIVAFATGNYLGSTLEAKLAFGLCSLHVILPENQNVKCIVDKLRAERFAVTIMDGQGKDGDRKFLVVSLRRKRIKHAFQIIDENTADAFVTVSDVKLAKGGFFIK